MNVSIFIHKVPQMHIKQSQMCQISKTLFNSFTIILNIVQL